MSDLLKISKARDDQDFVWRVTAAMMVYSQKAQFYPLGKEARELCTWVLANPLVVQPTMVNHVCCDSRVLAFVKADDKKSSAADVPDQTIIDVVDSLWTDVSRSIFGAIPPINTTPTEETP